MLQRCVVAALRAAFALLRASLVRGCTAQLHACCVLCRVFVVRARCGVLPAWPCITLSTSSSSEDVLREMQGGAGALRNACCAACRGGRVRAVVARAALSLVAEQRASVLFGG